MNATVSIIMAARNAEYTLGAAIRSVQAQTYADWELLICDDCSDDSTCYFARAFAESDSRIQLFCNYRNMKQAYSRNLLIKNAVGKYIAILDADDTYEPSKLEVQTRFLDEHPEYAFCAAWARIADDNGRVRKLKEQLHGKVDKRDYLWGMPFTHASAMFRAEALGAAHGYRVSRDTAFRNEDYDLFMRLANLGYDGYVIPEYLYNYRVGADTLKRRKYRYRWAEAKVRYENFKKLGLMPEGLPYAVKPLITGLVPQRLLDMLRG